jgi:5'-3' exonuclease
MCKITKQNIKMARVSTNKDLLKARKEKNDEFYTILVDIEKELKHYKGHFKDKVVYCNCDDPYESNFFKYFAMRFYFLGLKKLIATCYAGSPISNTELSLFPDESEENKTTRMPHKIEITEIPDMNQDGAVDLIDVKLLVGSDKNHLTRLRGDGDFRSKECIEFLKEADIVVTNPPFSLFREYVAQIAEYDKKFLIVGTWNAITYKEIFKLIKEDRLWLGINSNRNFSGFIVPKHYELYGTEARVDEDGNRIVSTNNTCWFTNLDVKKRHEEFMLCKKYSPEDYPKYDNYDAIDVSKTIDIPCDYDAIMGVPITFLDKYNPDQFEIVGKTNNKDHAEGFLIGGEPTAMIKGKKLYHRILIRNKTL